MKLKKNILILGLLPVTLMGCNGAFSKHVKCDDVAGLGLVETVLKEQLDKSLDKDLKDLINRSVVNDLDPAKLKLSAKSVQYALRDSRTDHIDPDSTKTSCSLDLTISIPADLVKKSNEAREVDGADTIEVQANKNNVDFSNGKIEMVLNYVLQPTDKGDKVIATVLETESARKLVSDTLVYAFLKPQFDKNRVQAEQNYSSGYGGGQTEEDAQGAVEQAMDIVYE